MTQGFALSPFSLAWEIEQRIGSSTGHRDGLGRKQRGQAAQFETKENRQQTEHDCVGSDEPD